MIGWPQARISLSVLYAIGMHRAYLIDRAPDIHWAIYHERNDQMLL